MVDTSIESFLKALRQVAVLNGESEIFVTDRRKFRDQWVEPLLQASISHENVAFRPFAAWLLNRLVRSCGVAPASIHNFHRLDSDRRKLVIPRFTAPDFTFATARSLFKSAVQLNARAFQVDVTHSAPFAARVLMAAAVREDFAGPIFLGLRVSGEEAIAENRLDVLLQALKAGVFHFDLDLSTWVREGTATLEEKYKEAAKRAAHWIKDVRENEPAGVECVLGLRSWTTQDKPTTIDDLRAFLDLLLSEMGALDLGSKRGICKLSIVLPKATAESALLLDVRPLNDLQRLMVAYKICGLSLDVENALNTRTQDALCGAGLMEVCTPLAKLEEWVIGLKARNSIEALADTVDAVRMDAPMEPEWKGWVGR